MKNSSNDHPKKKKSRSASIEHRLNVARARALVAEMAAAEARANEQKMTKQAAFWKAEALREKERAKRADAYAYALYRKFQNQDCRIHNLTRERLINALRLLGSDQAEERASAALLGEKQRLMLGKTWNELIVREHRTNDAHDDRPKKRKMPSDDDDGDYDFDGYFEGYEGPVL